jgi:hypothetical protein
MEKLRNNRIVPVSARPTIKPINKEDRCMISALLKFQSFREISLSIYLVPWSAWRFCASNSMISCTYGDLLHSSDDLAEKTERLEGGGCAIVGASCSPGLPPRLTLVQYPL